MLACFPTHCKGLPWLLVLEVSAHNWVSPRFGSMEAHHRGSIGEGMCGRVHAFLSQERSREQKELANDDQNSH